MNSFNYIYVTDQLQGASAVLTFPHLKIFLLPKMTQNGILSHFWRVKIFEGRGSILMTYPVCHSQNMVKPIVILIFKNINKQLKSADFFL